MTDTEEIPQPGQKAYSLYHEAMKGTNTKGEALPSWDELRPTIQEAFAAVEAGLR